MQVTLLTALWVLWAIITAVLAGAIIYRSLIGMKEADQLFLDSAEESLQAEQQAIVIRVERLNRYVKVLALASAAVLFLIAVIWIYRGIAGFNSPTAVVAPLHLSKPA